MLTKEEETRLKLCLNVAEVDVDNKLKVSRLVPETTLWLARKLQETNTELSRLTEELYKSNETLAKISEIHE